MKRTDKMQIAERIKDRFSHILLKMSIIKNDQWRMIYYAVGYDLLKLNRRHM